MCRGTLDPGTDSADYNLKVLDFIVQDRVSSRSFLSNSFTYLLNFPLNYVTEIHWNQDEEQTHVVVVRGGLNEPVWSKVSKSL